MDESHFIPLHSAVKLKKLFSVRKAFFQNRFLLCCISFCLLGKILLVSCIQMDFARRKQSGYARLGKMDFQRPVHAAKKVFGSYPVWKTSLFTKRSLLMLHAFAFRLFFPKRKAFTDIHRNVSLVLSVMIRQGRTQTATSQLSHGPSGAWLIYHPCGHVITSTYSYIKGIEYSKMCGSLNCQWLGMAGGLLVEEQRRWIRWSYVYIYIIY